MHPTRTPLHIFLLALVLALGAAACGRGALDAEPAPVAIVPRPVPARALEAQSGVAPEPPFPGRIDVTVHGDVSLALHGEGASCEDGGFYVTSNDVVGLGAGERWVLMLVADELYLSAGAALDDVSFLAKHRMRPDAPWIDVDAVLVSPKSTGRVQVRGRVECARPPRGPVPPAIVASLGAASGRPTESGRGAHPATVSARVPADEAREVVRRVRRRLPSGWVAFVGAMDRKGVTLAEVDVVIAPGRDGFDAVHVAGTRALRSELGPEAIVKELRELHALAAFDLWQADAASIRIELASVPADVPRVAKVIAGLSPEAVRRHGGSSASLEAHLAKERDVQLSWD